MQEISLAAARGTKESSALALQLGSDVKAGDFITVRGEIQEVVAIDNRRMHIRALLRKVT